jgi:hypothetical protein
VNWPDGACGRLPDLTPRAAVGHGDVSVWHDTARAIGDDAAQTPLPSWDCAFAEFPTTASIAIATTADESLRTINDCLLAELVRVSLNLERPVLRQNRIVMQAG